MARASSNASSTYEYLTELGYTAEQELCQRKVFVCSEHGVTYRLEELSGYPSVSFGIDGNIISDNDREKCDKLLLVEYERGKWVRIFIELKGSNILHAIKQIQSTLEHPIFTRHQEPLRARIIARKIPKNSSDPSIEKAKKQLSKKHKCELKISHTGKAETFTPPE